VNFVDQNLRHLIKEFRTIFQTLATSRHPEGQDHIRKVQAKLLSPGNNNPPIRQKSPEEKPVCRYLDDVRCEGNRYSELCDIYKNIAPLLKWEYGYTSMPEHLYDMYSYTEVIGPQGNIYVEDIVMGFVLLAPGCLYPEHKHPGIEESYLCLSGNVTQNDNEELSPGGYLYNSPGKTHRLSVAPDAPCLLAYAWLAEPAVLKNYSMSLL